MHRVETRRVGAAGHGQAAAPHRKSYIWTRLPARPPPWSLALLPGSRPGRVRGSNEPYTAGWLRVARGGPPHAARRGPGVVRAAGSRLGLSPLMWGKLPAAPMPGRRLRVTTFIGRTGGWRADGWRALAPRAPHQQGPSPGPTWPGRGGVDLGSTPEKLRGQRSL